MHTIYAATGARRLPAEEASDREVELYNNYPAWGRGVGGVGGVRILRCYRKLSVNRPCGVSAVPTGVLSVGGGGWHESTEGGF